MNIIHIIPSLRKGGAERLVLNICNELQKRTDVVVKLVVLHPENEYEFLSKDLDIELCNSKVVPSISGKTIADIYDLEKIISDFKPDIIHSHLFEAEMVSRWNLFPGIRYSTHCHNNMKQFRNFSFNTLLSKTLLTNFYEKKLLLKKYYSCNNKFIAISKNTEAYFKKNLPKNLQNNVLRLNNAIDFNRFSHKERNLQSFDRLTIKLVSIGSLIEIKNHLFLIDVINILNNKGTMSFNLIIIGEGPMRPVIEDRINEYKMQERIRLIGLTDDVEEYLKEADLYVYSCIKEGFGLTLIEAMASGLPVVCLDGGGNRDIIVEGKNGFMIHEQDPELFADKIMELIENKELYNSMSEFSVQYAMRFDIKNYADRLLEIYST